MLTLNYTPEQILKDRRRIMSEVFISIDVETDGPCPGLNSMWSIGAVAFTLKDGFLGDYTANLKDWPGASPNPDTMESFWDKPENAEARAAARADPLLDPQDAMWGLLHFVNDISEAKTPVAAYYPAGFDHTWVYWYSHATIGLSPFKWVAFDFKSYAMGLLHRSFRDTVKSNMPKSWFDWMAQRRHSHVALEDARDQASNMIAAMCEANEIDSPLRMEPANVVA